MIKKNGTNGGVTGLFAPIVNGDDGNRVSTQVLLCVKALQDARLNPIDLAEVLGAQIDQEVYLKMFDLLRHQEFITGPNEQAMLTTKGHRSLQTASANDYRVAQYLSNGQPALTQHDPSKLLISILRAHFDEWKDG